MWFLETVLKLIFVAFKVAKIICKKQLKKSVDSI